jgi:hypothetical protein
MTRFGFQRKRASTNGQRLVFYAVISGTQLETSDDIESVRDHHYSLNPRAHAAHLHHGHEQGIVAVQEAQE